MKTELFTVSGIFNETLYRIPDYQRGYSWNIDQLNDFWLDLEQIQNDAKHYLGVLTLETVSEKKWKNWSDDLWIIKSRNFNPYYVVDGQQRLTTIVLLITAILESKNIKYLNYGEIKDVRKKYIFDSKPEELSGSYIFGYERDNPSGEFLKTRIFGENSDIHHPKEETIYTKNLLAAKEFFKEKIDKMTEFEINTVFIKTTQQFVFNAYEISNDIDVFVTFETMNNRGKLLTTLELLKNRLIFISTKICNCTNNKDENKLRKIINEAWKAAYHYLGKNTEFTINDDEFLEIFLSYFYLTSIDKIPPSKDNGSVKERRRFEMFMSNYNRFLLNHLFSQKRIFKGGSPMRGLTLPNITEKFVYDFSFQLKSSIELYYQLVSPNDSEFRDEEKIILEQVNRLLQNRPNLLIYSIYKIEKNTKSRIGLMREVEKFYFILSFFSGSYIRRRRHGYEEFGIQYATGNMDGKKLLDQLKVSISSFFANNGLSDVLYDRLKNGTSGYYRWSFVKYFLFEYELYLQSKSKTNRTKIDWNIFSSENYERDYTTVEHIYPKQARNKYWTQRFSKYNSTQKRMLRNSLGNLLAISRPKNSSLSNKPFNEKRDAKTTGYRFGSYSENEVSLKDQWRPEEILERGLKILDFMEERWDLNIGDKNKKIKALGLSFLHKNK